MTKNMHLIDEGTLEQNSLPYRLGLLNPAHMDIICGLHDHVMQSLSPEEKTFILPRGQDYFERLFARGGGNAIMGIFTGDTLIAKCIIMHPAADAQAKDLGGAILSSDPGVTSIMQAATVHPEFRNMGLMRLMIKHWLAHAQSHGKTHVHAEIEVRNAASWNSFLKAGLNIIKVGTSPVDGAQVYSAEERIKYAMNKQLEAEDKFCDQTSHALPEHDIAAQKNLMTQGYVVTALDDSTRNLILQKRRA